MEAAAVASFGFVLRCSLNSVPKQQRRSALVGFATTRQPCAVTCRRSLLHLKARVYAAAAAVMDSGAGDAKVRRKSLAVFVSEGGSNFRSIYEAALGGRLNGHVVALVTDKPGCGGAEHARCNGILVVVFPKSKLAPEGVSTAELLSVLRTLQMRYVTVKQGSQGILYSTCWLLELIPGELVRAYPKSILKIHLSLLPAFGGKGYYGLKVNKAVIASGARGPNVHFVDEQFDTCKTLAQRVVPVLANDTLEMAARVLHEEHQVYVEAAAALCEDRVVAGRQCPTYQKSDKP